MKFNRDLEVRVMSQQENHIVFISYSQDSLSFADQVLSFANKLRREGIDAILDQYEEAPSEGWPRWMENSINRADYVIVIGSKGYYDKIYGNVELGKGRGVKWEGNLIYQKLYMERLRLSFYINDIATFSSIKVERGLNYPFARTMSFSLNATF